MKTSTKHTLALLACLIAADLAVGAVPPARIGGTTDRTGGISGIGSKPATSTPATSTPAAPSATTQRTIHRAPSGQPVGTSVHRNGRTEYTRPDGRPAGAVRDGSGASRPTPGTTPPQLRSK